LIYGLGQEGAWQGVSRVTIGSAVCQYSSCFEEGGAINHRYFKLVAFGDKDWLEREFRDGRARYGWSWPGSDLRQLRSRPRSELNEDERVTWRYTQFLIQRLQVGDRIICQFEQPLRKFWIGQIVEGGYEYDSAPKDDFNHILNIVPLCDDAVPVTAGYIPISLRHDLSKRGHYYEIYPEESIDNLNALIDAKPWLQSDTNRDRVEVDEFEDARSAVIANAIDRIHRQWPAAAFEGFCDHLCRTVDWIEVHSRQDTRQGWDLMIRILDPLTGEVLVDEIPVQCKNYVGDVTDMRPIEDLERSIRNSGSSIAYLFILGELTEQFRSSLDRSQEALSSELQREVTFRVLDQSAIADLYLSSLSGESRIGYD